MVEVSRESVDNKGTITNHTAAVSFLAFFWRLMLLQYIISGPGYNEKQHKKAGEKAMHVWTALAAGKNPRLMRRDNQWSQSIWFVSHLTIVTYKINCGFEDL